MDKKLINLFDYERLAQQTMDSTHFEYYSRGAADEISLQENRNGFDRLRLHPHVLAGVGDPDLSTSILGTSSTMPLIAAPAAMAKLAHPEGELGIAHAVEHAGVIQCLSTLSNDPMEAVVGSGANVWFQLYILKDRGLTLEIVNRAASAGCKAIVLTVDAPVAGLREGVMRRGFQFPPGMTLGNITGSDKANAKDVVPYIESLLDTTLTWTDLEWLASSTGLPVLVKGVLRADDARRAAERGARAVIVSNHGGRQLDTAIAGIDALAHVVAAVGSETEVYVDGGVRRGTDILKALAFGARAVLVGRPVLWGLAVGGQHGVIGVLDILRRELAIAMTLCGCSGTADVGVDLVNPSV